MSLAGKTVGSVISFKTDTSEGKADLPGVILDDVDAVVIRNDGRFMMTVDLCDPGLKSSAESTIKCPPPIHCPVLPACSEMAPCPEIMPCQNDDAAVGMPSCPEITPCPEPVPCPEHQAYPLQPSCPEPTVCPEPTPCPKKESCQPCPEPLQCASSEQCPEKSCPQPPPCPRTSCPTPPPCPEEILCLESALCPTMMPCPLSIPCPAPKPCPPPVPCPIKPINQYSGKPVHSTSKPCRVTSRTGQEHWRNYVIYALAGVNVLLCLVLFILLNIICRLRHKCDDLKETLKQYTKFQSQPPLDELGNDNHYNYHIGDGSETYRTLPLVPTYKSHSEFSSFYG
ncbi:hypothetical protein SK128_000848 [Halocaridina rubra]|uniref:Uncharacterized protein n=1 Tax=Halocaridina rubra TaxID=373956 RepID=A0AAN9AHM5_HALRR